MAEPGDEASRYRSADRRDRRDRSDSTPGAVNRGHPSLIRRRVSLFVTLGLVVGLLVGLGTMHGDAHGRDQGGAARNQVNGAAPAIGAPVSFDVSRVTASSATLSWAETSGAIGYRIYRGFGNGVMRLIWTADKPDRIYLAAHLRSGSRYRFAVAALDIGNHEARTADVTVMTPRSTDTTAPSAPASTTFSLSAFSSSRVDLTWGGARSPDVAYYEVLRGGVVVGTVERPSATKYSDLHLAGATSYSYSVRSVDSAGNRSVVVTKSVRTPPAGTVRIVRGPYALQVTGSSALIVWWSNMASTGSVTTAAGTVSDGTSTNVHRVRVTGLPAGTTAYTVRSGSASATGTVRRAAPAGQPFTFAVIGDYGAGTREEAQNAAQIGRYDSDFLQTVGDNLYPSSGFPDPDPLTTYSDLDWRFFKYMGGVLRTQAFFTANGNHEYYADGQWWNAIPMPGSNNSYYSYDWGDAHFLVLDTMRPSDVDSAQYSFARRDLAGAGARNAKWRIVVQPTPPYNATTSERGGSLEARTSLVPLFQKNGVDLVLSGDAHNYQRSYPLLNGKRATRGGVTYVVTGGGGNGKNGFSIDGPSWLAARAATFETLKVEVSSTALKVSAIASSGRLLDSVTLTPASR
jgi:hypothetical protein